MVIEYSILAVLDFYGIKKGLSDSVWWKRQPIVRPRREKTVTTLSSLTKNFANNPVYSQPAPLCPGQDLKRPRLVKTVHEQVTPHLFGRLC
jgi:hypothetical protein